MVPFTAPTIPDPPYTCPTDRLFLTGFMGSGKTRVAPVVAARLGWTWVDLDRLAAVFAQRSVEDLFAEGEAVFRRWERETLEKTFDRHQLIVATGGGALVQPDAMDAAKAAGTVVYLRASVDTILERVADGPVRPLLLDAEGQPLDDEARHARIEVLLAERMPIYEQAHIAVEVDGLDPRALGTEIAKALTALN